MEVIKLHEESEILNCLMDFEICFPHLKEKISDMPSFAKKLQKFAIVLVAQDNSKNIGMTAFYANDKSYPAYGYLTLIGVLPDYQGKGVGKFLLDKTIDFMKANGMQFIKLEVDLDNTSAQGFYKKHQFIDSGRASATSIYLKRKI